MAYICPRCGFFYLSEASIDCKKCGCEMIKTVYSIEDYDYYDDCDKGLDNIKTFKNNLYKEYCYSNPLFSSYQFDKRQQEEDAYFPSLKNINSNTKRCPKCGNTEFTPVRKKYSILTGFLTNKVELICNRCGAKIK